MAREKIITIGGTGLVGSVLVPHLSKYFEVEDHSIDSPNPANQLNLIDTPRFEEIVNANRKNTLAVINLAAATDTNRAFSDPEYQIFCRQINHQAPQDAAQFCRTIRLPFLHVSTDFVYDGKKPFPESYKETDQPYPVEPYGASKFEGETAVLGSGGTVLTLAFPFVENPLRPDLVQKFHRKLSLGQEVKAFSDQIITPTYIPDFAEITYRLLKKLVRQPDILQSQKFHCVGSSFESPYRVAQLIALHYGINPGLVGEASVLEYNRAAKVNSLRLYQVNLALSNLKVRQSVNFNPMTFEDALNRYPNQSV